MAAEEKMDFEMELRGKTVRVVGTYIPGDPGVYMYPDGSGDPPTGAEIEAVVLQMTNDGSLIDIADSLTDRELDEVITSYEQNFMSEPYDDFDNDTTDIVEEE